MPRDERVEIGVSLSHDGDRDRDRSGSRSYASEATSMSSAPSQSLSELARTSLDPLALPLALALDDAVDAVDVMEVAGDWHRFRLLPARVVTILFGAIAINNCSTDRTGGRV